MIETPVLILRKIPYHENSLITQTISPEHGRIDFIVKGARKVGKKSFPEVDIFREFNTIYPLGKHDLKTPHSLEMLNRYDDISHFMNNFLSACDLAKFLLRHIPHDFPAPRVYASFKTALRFWSESDDLENKWFHLVRLVYLDEQGLLPEIEPTPNESAERLYHRQNILDQTLQYAESGDINVQTIPANWEKMGAWIESLCRYHDLS